jgi:Uma2 family endonuclease
VALPAPLHRYAYSEYLALEEMSPVRHEFIRGDIFAMAGGTPEHAALAAAVLRLVGNRLPAGCRTYTSDLRVRIASSDVTTYPDGAVICGKIARAADDPLAVTNPAVLIEVTSSSTESYDRGPKLDQYKRLASLREIVIVSHAERVITVHRHDGIDWHHDDSRAGGAIELPSLGIRISVDDVYREALGED